MNNRYKMQTLGLIDYTTRFNSFLRHFKNADQNKIHEQIQSELNAQSKINNTNQINEKLNNIIKLIDTEIIELQNIYQKLSKNITDIDFTNNCLEEFKKSVNKINIMTNGLITFVKRYETTDPLIYKSYVLLIKDKLEKTEAITKNFNQISNIPDNNHLIPKQYSGTYDTASNFSLPKTTTHQLEQSLLVESDKSIELTEIVSERGKQISEIVSSMTQIHQQFVDVQIMVALQGEQINHIDDQIIKSLDYVEKGKTDIGVAQVYHEQSNSLKRNIVGGIIIFGTIATAITFGLKKTGIV